MMRINISKFSPKGLLGWLKGIEGSRIVLVSAILLSIASISYCFANDFIVTYGDSESHLNISKRVVDSITPGFAQLGGIWLPIPHLLMLPFIKFDFLWRTGLAGSIVSGLGYVVASLYLYKTLFLITKNKLASIVGASVFMLNPNVLYMQSTPMTEVLLIAFFALSSYYFIRFLHGINQTESILLSAFFGFCSVLTRYDGWFLVVLEAGCIFLYYFPWGKIPYTYSRLKSYLTSVEWSKMEGLVFMFSTLAFFGIALWLVWDFLILGDPLFFTHSEFSAKSQQNEWLSRGQLPGYHHILLSFLYYFVTAMSNAGIIVFAMAIVGLAYFLSSNDGKNKYIIGLVLGAPFIFNVITQFLGQSVIFIPHLTPIGFDWRLFNVRYGVMTVPLVSILIGYLFFRVKPSAKLLVLFLMVVQLGLYGIGYSKVISWEDGVNGLSAAKRPDAERWIKSNYDFGNVLMDDYARTISVVRSGVPMQNMIYIGNKPYWQESLVEPEKYARWVVMQRDDSVWKELWDNPAKQARLYKYFEKAYTSPEILIFRRQSTQIVERKQQFWNFQCIDTMKYSRDQARGLAASSNLKNVIDTELNLIVDSGATCVSLGTPYDEEFVPYLSAWVQAARARNLKVWFRGNMSGWEGWFGYKKFLDYSQHNEGVRSLITKHPELFKEGDIFTPAPEPENGMIGDPRFSEVSKEKFFEFLPSSYDNCQKSFLEIKVEVSCGYFSFNGDIASQVVTKDLLVKIGDVLVIDHYVKTAERLSADIKALHDKFGGSIVLGEFGGPIPGIHGEMTEEQQANYIDEVMAGLYAQKDILLGMNYWVLNGGSTSLVNESDMSPRAAYKSLRSYFAPAQVSGVVTDVFGNPVKGVRLVSDEYNAETETNLLGEYTLILPAKKAKVRLEDDNWSNDKVNELTLESNRRTVVNYTVEPKHPSLKYRFMKWIKFR